MSAGKAMYPTLEAYYADDERRLQSEERDYGAHWRLKGWEGLWRISYVRDIGEIYAVHEGSTVGPVFVLAIIPLDPKADCDRRSLFYAALDGILDGRPEQCGLSDSLRRVKDRLANIDMTHIFDWSEAVPEDVSTAERCLGCGSQTEATTGDERRSRVRLACPRCRAL